MFPFRCTNISLFSQSSKHIAPHLQDALDVGEVVATAVVTLVVPRWCCTATTTYAQRVHPIALVDVVDGPHQCHALRSVAHLVEEVLLQTIGLGDVGEYHARLLVAYYPKMSLVYF